MVDEMSNTRLIEKPLVALLCFGIVHGKLPFFAKFFGPFPLSKLSEAPPAAGGKLHIFGPLTKLLVTKELTSVLDTPIENFVGYTERLHSRQESNKIVARRSDPSKLPCLALPKDETSIPDPFYIRTMSSRIATRGKPNSLDAHLVATCHPKLNRYSVCSHY